jgi:cytosine/adenosine deaminase-related metal-dependent hydrolase
MARRTDGAAHRDHDRHPQQRLDRRARGRREPRDRTGDVAFTGDTLTQVGGLYTGAADREIDGRGFMVMPGLVNIHSHPASEPLNKGWNDGAGSPKLYNSSTLTDHADFRPDAEGVKAAFRVAL